MLDQTSKVEAAVIAAVSEVAGRPADIDTNFRVDLGMDGLDMIEVSLEIEDTVGVQMDDTAIEFLTTVRDLVKEVEKRLGQ